jgi:hypothetical protein
MSDGTFQCRPNVVEEVGRARTDPRLKSYMIVAKAPHVRLWSNINPTYDRLDVEKPADAIDTIIAQLEAWSVLPARLRADTKVDTEARAGRAQLVPAATLSLFDGIGLGDHDKAAARMYAAFSPISRDQQHEIVDELVRITATAEDHTQQLVACSLLEAADRIDPSLVRVQVVEALSQSESFSIRSCAAVLLWQWAESHPGRVPLALLGRLAKPVTEDWYVQAPAMAAVKHMMLQRPDARVIVDALTYSDDAEERYAAARALLDVARVTTLVVPRDTAERLAQDSDADVAGQGVELLSAIEGVTDKDRWGYFHRFGM